MPNGGHRITLIPGDGIGPEIAIATRRVLDASGARLSWDVQEVGAAVAERHEGNPLPEHVLASIRQNGVALKGPVSTPAGTGFRSVNIGLRRSLDLFAQVRPAKSLPGVRSPFHDVDVVVIRETTEDLYAGIEFEKGTEPSRTLIGWLAQQGHRSVHRDSGVSIKTISEPAARRIFAFAFDYARRNRRRRVTAVHKATVMKFTDGLFLEAARDVAGENRDIEFDDRMVDHLATQLVRRPDELDVLVMPNLYGDIVSDLTAGLVGGVGLAPGANFGPEAALFEPAHGTAPKYAGQNKANPIGMMLSGAMMLHFLEEDEAADRVEGAIAAVVEDGRRVTYDLKPTRDDPSAVGTSDVADAVIETMERMRPAGLGP